MKRFHPWTIVDVDVSTQAPDLEFDRAGGVLLYAWWRHLPLGHSYIKPERLPVSSEQLREELVEVIRPSVERYLREAHATDVEAFLRASAAPVRFLNELAEKEVEGSPPSVSVVICTRDRPTQLAACLNALSSLTVQPNEIIVVDNAPTSDETRQLVETKSSVRYILEERPGLDIARNAGQHAAISDVVAYVDDDVAIDTGWLAGVVRGFADSSVMAITGLVLAAELETEAQETFERNWPFNRGYVPRVYGKEYFAGTRKTGTPAWEIGAGANMAFRRELFDLIGDFDERLDVGAAGCSGDSEYWYRILAKGYKIRYEPSAAVRHYHRREMPDLRKQLRAYMRGHTAALLVQYERTGERGNIRRLFVSLPYYYLKLWIRRIINGKNRRNQFIGTEIAGAVAGVRYYFQHRNKDDFPTPQPNGT